MTEHQQSGLIAFGIIASVMSLIVYMIDKACKADKIKWNKIYAEQEAELNAKLEAELKKPKTRLHIETFDDYYFTKYFEPFIGRIGLGHRDVRSSQSIAESTMASSFNRGYFITNDGIHIPTRLIKSVKYTESK